ncbi:MAG: biopolymer transporter ExbD [Candidatus Krumholzibacteriia bacterium]|nr:biopolymer transporter ExbD [bacterium]MCB9513285.1 biopolymer transporter ExbD [Candidatus Latescibacterota bacterium]MCB9514746.1 biopolymer transporter ExbD [Candidatus Latescibacterota bacterium]
MRIEKPDKPMPGIPTSTMGDIVFLLLIFFMTTTIFKHENGLEVTLPRAEAAKKQKTEQLAQVWVDQKGRISINDKLVRVPDIQAVMKRRLEGNPLLIVSFKADSRVKYEVMNSIMEELKGINAVRVVFSSDMESSRR